MGQHHFFDGQSLAFSVLQILVHIALRVDHDGATGVQFLENGDSTGTYSEDEVKDGKFESVGIR